MDATYYTQALAYLLGAWLSGYLAGLLIWAVKRFLEQL